MRPPPRIAVGNIPHNIVRYIVRSIVGLFDSLNCCAKYHKLARIIACNVVRNRYPPLKFLRNIFRTIVSYGARGLARSPPKLFPSISLIMLSIILKVSALRLPMQSLRSSLSTA